MSDVEKYVGAKTIEKMRATKVHGFSRAISDILYECDVSACKYNAEGDKILIRSTPETKDSEKKFSVSLHVHGGDRVPKDAPYAAGHGGQYIDVRKFLLELRDELERLSLKEVT